jgi:hypothetical protein
MDNTREKLIELVDEAEEHSEYICVHTRECEDCPGRKYGDKCREYLKADHLIANGVTVQKWIPVTERLPEESGDYLVYCGEYDGICVLYCEVLKTKSKLSSEALRRLLRLGRLTSSKLPSAEGISLYSMKVILPAASMHFLNTNFWILFVHIPHSQLGQTDM